MRPTSRSGLVREFGEKDGVCNGADSCRRAVREQLKYGADNIKICASGGVLSETDPVDVPQLTPEELRAIVDEAHAWRRKVAAHAHGDRAARMAVDAGVDSIEHGSFLTPETLQRMKEKGVYLVPTRMTVKFVEKQASTYPPQVGEEGARSGGRARRHDEERAAHRRADRATAPTRWSIRMASTRRNSAITSNSGWRLRRR